MSQCLNCQFYDRKSARAADARGLQWGLCRRAAPHLNPAAAKTHTIEGVWPTVRDDDWCGEWQLQRKPESAPSAAVVVQGASKSLSAAARGPSTIQAGPRTVPIHGSAASIAAGYKPTGAKPSSK